MIIKLISYIYIGMKVALRLEKQTNCQDSSKMISHKTWKVRLTCLACNISINSSCLHRLETFIITL